MTHWTVQCSYASYYTNTVSVEAQTLEAALGLAIEMANDSPTWSASDYCGPTHIDAVAQGDDVDLWFDAIDAQLPVPDRFTERGPCAYITVTLEGGLIGHVQIANGPATLEIRDYDIEGIAADRLAFDDEQRLCALSVFPDPTSPQSSQAEKE